MQRTVFNQAQIEVINAMASLKTEEEVMALKLAISEFFARRADEELNRLWSNDTLSQEKLDSLRGQHFRTAY